MLTIDPDRLPSDLEQLHGFGATGPEVVRLAVSPVDRDSRRWLAGRMTDAALDAAIDGAGTVFGRSICNSVTQMPDTCGRWKRGWRNGSEISTHKARPGKSRVDDLR